MQYTEAFWAVMYIYRICIFNKQASNPRECLLSGLAGPTFAAISNFIILKIGEGDSHESNEVWRYQCW